MPGSPWWGEEEEPGRVLVYSVSQSVTVQYAVCTPSIDHPPTSSIIHNRPSIKSFIPLLGSLVHQRNHSMWFIVLIHPSFQYLCHRVWNVSSIIHSVLNRDLILSVSCPGRDYRGKLALSQLWYSQETQPILRNPQHSPLKQAPASRIDKDSRNSSCSVPCPL